MKAVSRIAQTVFGSETVRGGVFSHVGFCRTEEGSPFGVGVGTVEREREGGSRDHTEDESVVVEASAVFGVEGVRVGGRPEQATGAGDGEARAGFDEFEDRGYVRLIGTDGWFDEG